MLLLKLLLWKERHKYSVAFICVENKHELPHHPERRIEWSMDVFPVDGFWVPPSTFSSDSIWHHPITPKLNRLNLRPVRSWLSNKIRCIFASYNNNGKIIMQTSTMCPEFDWNGWNTGNADVLSRYVTSEPDRSMHLKQMFICQQCLWEMTSHLHFNANLSASQWLRLMHCVYVFGD